MSIGIGTLLGITFIVLRLTHVIAWSWIWVLAPFWISAAISLFFLIVVAAFGFSKARTW